MAVVINQKIVGYSVIGPGELLSPGEKIEPFCPPVLAEREPVLTGKTYKLKTPLSEHALYVTINDQDSKPFEIFINCKAMEHFQWIVALTRVISAVFRHGGESAFLVDELMAVVDPKGGYFYKGQYRPSLVSEIGSILKEHLLGLGLIQEDRSLADAAKAMVDEKQNVSPEEDGYPENATTCQKCLHRAEVIMDGCMTCLNCGNSKCG